MYNVGVAFEVLEEESQVLKGWNKGTGHLVWDVKMYFTHKVRWVLDGHNTLDLVESTYTGVVSLESVRITFTYTTLNDQMSLLLILKMLTFKHHHPRKTVSSASLCNDPHNGQSIPHTVDEQ